LKIFALAKLWQVEWTAHCSNTGCLVDHTSPAWALIDNRNNAITQMFRDEQNKLGYCYRMVVVEAAKPIIMANAFHQGLQGSFFFDSLSRLQNPINQMYPLSYRVKFI